MTLVYPYRFPNRRDPASYKGGRSKRAHPKWTSFVSYEEARNIIEANRFAAKVGVPINAHVTIDFNDKIADNEAPAIISRMLKTWRQWLRRRGVDGSGTTEIWAREKRAGMLSHVHLLLHIPETVLCSIDTRKMASFLPKTAFIDPMQIPRWPKPKSGVAVYLSVNDTSAENWGKYIIKGIAEEHAAEFGRTASREGRIQGKRTHVADNVNIAARKRWAFDVKVYGREFAITRWQEHARMAKRFSRPAAP